MSLAQYAVYQGTAAHIELPDNNTQLTQYKFIPPSGGNEQGGLEPGDVVYFGQHLSSYAHSGVYAGDGEIWDDFDYGIPVQEHTFAFLMGTAKGQGDYEYLGAYRYPAKSAPPFSITTGSLPAGVTQKSYAATLHAAVETPLFTWSLVKGSKPLPPGLKLGSTTGVISGDATTVGSYSFQIQVVDTGTVGLAKQTAKRTLSIKIT